MVFNSLQFAGFFAVMFVAYWRLEHRHRKWLLLIGSYVFYGSWDWRFLGLIVVSTVVDYAIGRRLGREDTRHRTALLFASMATNLGILGIFKYANFFADSAARFLGDIGLSPNEPFLQLVLPVGISFYTFQTMSYTIDVYRGRLDAVHDPVLFATFVAYFPQLVAGPIERARDLLPQLAAPARPLDRDRVASGIGLVLLGLTKKVVLADGVASVADQAFEAPGQLSSIAVWAGVLAFAIQIYGDFSGYTDIARGVSRLLGIELTLNFTQPYLSRNITEFWRRWHITLSNWLRDYLYIPLGGNRHGPSRTYVNLMLTMLLGGLWHGASWNFVLWGGLHGAMLAAHRALRGGRVPSEQLRLVQLPAIVTTAGCVILAWVFFRASDFSNAIDVFRGLAPQRGVWSAADVVMVAAAGSAMLVIDLVARRSLLGVRSLVTHPALTGSAVAVATVAIIVFSGGAPRPFVYFQF